MCGISHWRVCHARYNHVLVRDIPALTKEYTTPEISHNLRTSFLPLIPELEMVVGLVAEAADALIAGDRNLAYARLCQANLPTVRTYAARIICQTDPLVHRYPLIRHPKERQIRTPRPTESVKAKIYARDGCRCRYCACVSSCRRPSLCWRTCFLNSLSYGRLVQSNTLPFLR